MIFFSAYWISVCVFVSVSHVCVCVCVSDHCDDKMLALKHADASPDSFKPKDRMI